MDSIKSGIANLFDKGKYAAIEKEDARMKYTKESFPDAVKEKVKEMTKEAYRGEADGRTGT